MPLKGHWIDEMIVIKYEFNKSWFLHIKILVKNPFVETFLLLEREIITEQSFK
jgi:hypothetical protein